MCKVSIIIPVYNVEKYLDKCVQSARNQTLQDIEIILVDDESPDGCPQMCDEYAKIDSRIKVIHKKNGGLGFARNSGLEVATGEYVTFLDSDDYIDLNTYEDTYKIAIKHNLDIIRFSNDRFKKEGKYTGTNYSGELTLHSTKKEMEEIALCIFAPSIDTPQKRIRYNGSSCFALFRKETIIKNNIMFPSEREILGEDYVFCFKFMMCAQRFGYINNTYYHYRFNPNSLTQTPKKDKVEKAIYNCVYLIKMFNEYNLPKESLVYPKYYFINTVRTLTHQVLSSNIHFEEKRKWIKELSENIFIKKINTEFPLKRISLFYRNYYSAVANNCFIKVYLMSSLMTLKNKLKTN